MKYRQPTVAPPGVQAWLQGELEGRGIDTVYARTVLSLLLQPDGPWDLPARRVAAVECLCSAAEQKNSIEALVDELCRRLDNHLQSGKAPATATVQVLERSPQELAQMYYAAFPALSSAAEEPRRVSWDGRRIIRRHEQRRRRDLNALRDSLCQTPEERRLRRQLSDPRLAAIWGRTAPTRPGSVWALSTEETQHLKAQEVRSLPGFPHLAQGLAAGLLLAEALLLRSGAGHPEPPKDASSLLGLLLHNVVVADLRGKNNEQEALCMSPHDGSDLENTDAMSDDSNGALGMGGHAVPEGPQQEEDVAGGWNQTESCPPWTSEQTSVDHPEIVPHHRWGSHVEQMKHELEAEEEDVLGCLCGPPSPSGQSPPVHRAWELERQWLTPCAAAYACCPGEANGSLRVV
ncbi:uncharacterized protein LOC135377382 [Ornithodoros turicata]|uniref:Uncharacterized protein n=1 Tax=Ornithodoros turicata TaxID=34597 RepID=A0A2R5LG81_9ACAR